MYYFNGVTGESTWEKPTPTFPDVTPEGAKNADKKEGGGLFGALFGGDKKKKDESQLDVGNDDFLSELDDVIAEAEEAIKIAEEIENEPAKKGGLFSAFGFSKKEATAESLIADAEERTSKIEKAVGAGGEKKGLFSVFGGSKAKVEEKVEVVETSAQEENVWTEGLKNLFQRYVFV